MPVSTPHPDYTRSFKRWQFVRDAVAGQDAIKRRGTAYLPATFAEDTKDAAGNIVAPADMVRYRQYIERAYFMGVTGRTKEALTGMVFRKPPAPDLPPAVEAMLENIDGAGQSLEQLSKALIGELMTTGRYGLLVDYPQAPENADSETERRMGLRPTVAAYPAESIINWRFEGVNGRKLLTLVVLAEEVDDATDEFAHDTEAVYRVLRLREGVYTQALYDESGAEITDEYAPRMAGGATFDHIPFHVAGATDNYPEPDIAPLYDMAVLNIAHYQSTAELKENQFFSAQGTLHLDVGTMSTEDFQMLNPNGVTIGRRNGLVTMGGGSATLLQGDSRQRDILDTMAHEEAQMVAIGARLVQRGGQAETAEAARLNASAEASTLDNLVNNASECIEAALEDVARFVGAEPENVLYRLNKSFWESSLTAQDLQAIQQGVGTIYGALDALEMIREGRIVLSPDRDNETIMQDAAESLLTGDGGMM